MEEKISNEYSNLTIDDRKNALQNLIKLKQKVLLKWVNEKFDVYSMSIYDINEFEKPEIFNLLLNDVFEEENNFQSMTEIKEFIINYSSDKSFLKHNDSMLEESV